MAAHINAFAKVFAWLEMRHVLARQGYCLASLRVASDPRRSEMQRKAAKPTYFDAPSLGQ